MNKLKIGVLLGLVVSGVIGTIFYITAVNPKQSNIAQYDHPDLAELREFNMTKDPKLGYPPVERLKNAYAETKARLESKREIQNVNWTERGPNNFGGRTRALMFDPNDPTAKKVWAAGVIGGLWVTEDITDPTAGWTKHDDFLPSLAVNNITYDPNDKSVFYFGTGEGWFGGGMAKGEGIWKSTDAGNTWNVLASSEVEPFDYIQKIAVTSNSTVLAATRGTNTMGGLYRSTDGGTSWTQVISGRAADIEIVGNTIYASIGIQNQGSLHKSTDDGVTWTVITPNADCERIEIAVTPEFPNVVYAVASLDSDVSWFYRSDNSGQTWISLTIPKYLSSSTCTNSTSDFARQQAWYDLILGIYPKDPKVVMVGGIDLHRSTNGGTVWEPVSYWTSACETTVHADQHNMVFRPGFPDQAIFSNDGGVFYCEDILVSKAVGGPVFEARNKNYNVTQFYACAALNEAGSDYFLAGAQDNGSHQFTSKGINSTLEVTGGDGAFCFIDQNEPNIQITSYVYNSYFLTTDYFDGYEGFGSGDKGDFINPCDYNSNTNTLFAAGGSAEILRYADLGSGDIVEEVLPLSTNGTFSAITVSPYDDNIVFAAAGQILYRISGANDASPVATVIGNDFGGAISSIAVGTSNNQLLITQSNYGVASVFLTTDGGTNWTNKEGANLPDMPVRWALFNPNNTEEVLLATELGIWSTENLSDADPEWGPSNAGLANVRCDMIKYRDADGLVVIATHGRGLYTTDIFASSPIAYFYVPQMVSSAGNAVEFKDASLKASSYQWNFGDGASSTNKNPVHTYLTAGSYDVTLTINGDNTKTITNTVVVLPSYAPDYTLASGGDFETNTSDFASVTISGSGFELGSSALQGKNGTHSGSKAWVLAPADAKYKKFSEAYVYTPSFDFSLSGTYTLEFYAKYVLEDEWDYFGVEYSTDKGYNWSVLGEEILDAANWHNQIAIDFNGIYPPGKPFFSGNSNGVFEKKTLSFTNLSNQETVQFRFVFKSDPGTEEAGVAIDDFQLFGPSSSTPNLSFETNAESLCTNTVIQVVNNSSGAITSYSWNFGTGAIPATGVGYGPFDVVYTSTGSKTITLTAATSGGDQTSTVDFSIDTPPADLGLAVAASNICKGDVISFNLPDSEVGVSYQLYNIASGTVAVGNPVVGTGGEIVLEATLDANSIFKVTAEKEGGCQTIFADIVAIDAKLKPTVDIKLSSTGTLSTTFAGASEYIWLLNGEVVEGATGQTYKPTAQGSYQVGVSNGGCIGYSSELAILSNEGILTGVSVYPNPSSDVLNYDLPVTSDLKLYDMSGKFMMELKGVNGKGKLNISQLRNGNYLLKIQSASGQSVLKIIKE